MLHEGVAAGFRANVARLAGLPGVRTLLDESRPGTPGFRSGAVVLAVATAAAQLELLHTECFGPAALVVEYGSAAELLDLLDRLDGCLVATVHGEPDEPLAADLVRRLARIAGRIVWNGWPTGVSVTAGQHHGGPHPATTNPLHTSVGTAAVTRFLRPVTYQDLPATLLPPELRG